MNENSREVIEKIGIYLFFLILTIALSWGRINYEQPKMDFASFYYGGRAYFLGENMYDREVLQNLCSYDDVYVYPYVYTPILAEIFGLSSDVNIIKFQSVWTLLNIFFFATSLFLLFLVAERNKYFNRWYVLSLLLFLTIALPFRYIQHLGQIDPLILLLISGAVFSVERRSENLGGFLFAWAVLLKLSPIFLLLFFLSWGKLKFLKVYALSTGFLMFASLTVGGVEPWISYFNFAIQSSQNSEIASLATLTDPQNYSLLAVLSRLDIPSAKIMAFVINISLISTFTYIFARYREQYRINVTRFLLPFTVISIIFFPYAWRQHSIYLLPAVFLLLSNLNFNSAKLKYIIFIGLALIFTALAGFDFGFFYEHLKLNDNTNLLNYYSSLNLYFMIALLIMSLFFAVLKVREKQ